MKASVLVLAGGLSVAAPPAPDARALGISNRNVKPLDTCMGMREPELAQRHRR